MILWMAFSALFALLVSFSARAAESAARSYGRAVRGIWVAALLVSALLPAAIWLTGVRWPGLLPWSNAGAVIELPLVSDVAAGHTDSSLDDAHTSSIPLQRAAQTVWIALSAVAFAWFGFAWRRLIRARASWRPHVLRDQRVLLSATSGPAVIGFYHPSIVVPHWVLTETASVQRMILLHEQEHAKSGDHVLLALAPLLLVALPWNLPLWWQAKRLRLAIELDCDARVLRHGICPREYGTLLLELAGAHGSAAIAGASLVEPRTFLERRIIAMSSFASPYRHVRAVAGLAGAVLLGMAACESTTAMAPTRSPEPKEVKAEVTEKPLIEFSGRGPLLIVDGVSLGRYNLVDSPLKQVDLIGSIEIIKGQSAVARYGDAGRDGVIVVSTKGRNKETIEVLIDTELEPVKGVVALDKSGHKYGELKVKGEVLVDGVREVGPAKPRVLIDEKVRARGIEKIDAPAVPTTKPKVLIEGREIASKIERLENKTRSLTTEPVKLKQGEPVLVDVKEMTLETKERVLDKPDVQSRTSPEKLSLTFRGLSQPLLFVDGREVGTAALGTLKADDIDSIEVLKGTAALQLYGERGRNGVILIKTRGDS